MARGHYTFEEVKDWTREQWYFIFHYQELAIAKQEDFFTNALGVLWDAKSLRAQQSGKIAKVKEKLFIPLSLAVNPDLLDFVYKQFGISSGQAGPDGSTSGQAYIGGGSYRPKSGEVVKSMSDMSKNEFLKKVGLYR